MLTYSTTINEIYTHIHEVIAGQVCRKMIYELGLKDIIKNHLYINSEVSGPSRSYNEVRLPILRENEFRCSIKYSTNPFGLKWDSTTPGQHMDPSMHRADNMRTMPVFFDKRHDIVLFERYLPCNIELDCTLSFTDRVIGFDVMNRITSTYVRGELMMVNDLSYDYALPLGVIQKFHQLGQVIGLQKGTYTDWLDEYSGGQIQRIVSTRQNNQHAELVVKKHQWSSLAAVDYVPDSPEFVTPGTSMDAVTLHYTMTLQFGRVNMLYLKYPIALNNTLVPEQLVTVDRKEAYGSLYPFLKHPMLALDPAYQFQKFLLEHPARSPWYDDWDVPLRSAITASECKPFFIGLVLLDNDKCRCQHCECDCEYKYTTIDISTDLDQYKLVPDVLKWFEDHADIALNTDSKYSISVFRGDVQIDSSLLKFDGKVLSIPNCKGIDKLYHVVLSAGTKEYKDGSPWSSLILVFDIDAKKED